MAWITPSPSDTRAVGILATEWSAIGATSLPAGMTASEVFALAIENVVNHIRLKVGMPGRSLGAAGTIPDEVSMEFKALVVREFFARLPESVSKRFFGELRQQAALRADETLDRLSKTTGGIVPPDDPAPTEEQPSNNGAERLSLRTANTTRKQTDGLM